MKKVFVIEDDQPIREAMAELLEMEGYATETAENGQRALEKLAATSEKPDIFLLDLMMPVMDGFEFSAAKNRDPGLVDIPVVIMSADGNVDAKKAKLGAQGYIKKPADVDAILKLIGEVLSTSN